MASRYWQHNEPISCPKGHVMGWLGSVYWLCSRCRRGTDGRRVSGTIFVQVPDGEMAAPEKPAWTAADRSRALAQPEDLDE